MDTPYQEEMKSYGSGSRGLTVGAGAISTDTKIPPVDVAMSELHEMLLFTDDRVRALMQRLNRVIAQKSEKSIGNQVDKPELYTLAEKIKDEADTLKRIGNTVDYIINNLEL